MGQATKGVKIASLDAVFSFFWGLVIPSLAVPAFLLSELIGFDGDRGWVVLALVLIATLLFTEAAFRYGGPAWNPTGPLVFYAVGLSDDTIPTLLMRMPAMAAGAATGMWCAAALMPAAYRPLMGSGPQLKTDFYTGALAEGVLTFAINLVVLYTVLKVTSNRFLQTVLIVASAFALVKPGSHYTGPAMNPSDAFAWAFLNKRHASAEQVVVYWISPIVGTVAAAMLYRGLFGSPRDSQAPTSPKEKVS